MTKAELLSGSAAPTPNPAVTNGKRYMTRAEAAKYITDNWFPHSPKTLAKLAVIGGGPVFRKAGRVPRLALRSYVLTTFNIKLSRAQADSLLFNDGGNK